MCFTGAMSTAVEIASQLITAHTIIAGSRFIKEALKHEDTRILFRGRLRIRPKLLRYVIANHWLGYRISAIFYDDII